MKRRSAHDQVATSVLVCRISRRTADSNDFCGDPEGFMRLKWPDSAVAVCVAKLEAQRQKSVTEIEEVVGVS